MTNQQSKMSLPVRQRIQQFQDAVAEYQQTLYGPPPREEIEGFVARNMKQCGLIGTSVENWYRCWAISALQGTEPMYNNWKLPGGKHAQRRKIH